MHDFWKGVARFSAVVAAIFFVLAAVLSLFLVAIDRRLLDAATYKNALSRQQIYARLPRVIAEQIVLSLNNNPCKENPLLCPGISPGLLDCARDQLGTDRYNALTSGQAQPAADELALIQSCLKQFPLKPSNAGNEGGPPAFIKNLSAANWETVIGTLFPPDALRRTTENLIDQFFALLDQRQDKVILNLSDFKKRLTGQAGLDSLLAVVRAQPDCTDQQLQQLQAALLTGGGEATLCRPPEEILAQEVPAIQSLLTQTAGKIPDQYELLRISGDNNFSLIPFGPNTLAGAMHPQAFRLMHLGMRLSPDLALGFLLLITFFAVRTPKSWLRWWGIPFFLAGVPAILFALLLTPIFERSWLANLARQPPGSLSLAALDLGHDLARAVIQSLAMGIGFGGLFLALLGAGMWIASPFIKTRSAPLERPASPAEDR